MTKEVVKCGGAMFIRFQYRKRYEVTCDIASGGVKFSAGEFQYRKRYEVTCDFRANQPPEALHTFQYRKRYEVTCDVIIHISYPLMK